MEQFFKELVEKGGAKVIDVTALSQKTGFSKPAFSATFEMPQKLHNAIFDEAITILAARTNLSLNLRRNGNASVFRFEYQSDNPDMKLVKKGHTYLTSLLPKKR